MRGCFIALLVLFAALHDSFAQKEGNIWYFGNSAGIQFGTGTAKLLSNSKLNTTEGCASIADKHGNLVFYTDGISIWNKSHQIMANGTNLMGDPSSTQSAVIVPKPASTKEYYVFTVDNVAQPNGFRYSLVDISQEDGAGRVTIKNELMLTPVTEKLTAVSHENGKDFWVLVHGWNSNAFYAYLVTEEGVSQKAVVSYSGTLHNGRDNNTIGYMKAAPDGSKLALAVRGLKLYELFDFDNITGIVSNPTAFQSDAYNSAYGLEFSPDASKLYINSSLNPTAKIYQIDLSNNNTVTLIGTSASSYAGSLQLAPDGKIYFSRYQSNYLGVINNPNESGTQCIYIDNGLYLESKITAFGLPNFVQSWFYQPTFTFSQACFWAPTFFSITDTSNIQHVRWTFDDPVVGVINESTLKDPAHIFSNPGEYEVLLSITYKNGRVQRTSKTVVIPPPPAINLGEDKMLCAGQTLILNASLPRASYQWQNGSTEATFIVNQPGTYWVDVTVNGCPVRDSVTISYAEPISLQLGNDTVLCAGRSLQLNVQPSANVTYRWQDGSTGASFTVSQPGTYWLEASNGCETVKDSIKIDYMMPLPEIFLGNDTVLAPGKTLKLQVNIPNSTFLWQNGSTGNSFIVSAAGTYWVEATNGCQTARDSIKITYKTPIKIDLGRDTTLCLGSTLQLNAFSQQATYRWQDGSTNAGFTVNRPGTYWVEVSNTFITVTDSITVAYKQRPQIELGENIPLCRNEQLILTPKQQERDVTYRWQNGSTGASFIVSQPGTYWLEVSNGCETVKDSIIVYCPECVLEEMPNVITPNNDGTNDNFVFTCMNEQTWQIEIFNRWGRLVYASKHYLGEWKAENLDNGIYFYILTSNSSPAPLKGVIHVLR